MLRKTTTAMAAATALAAGAIPTWASADGGFYGRSFHHEWGKPRIAGGPINVGFYGAYAYDPYYGFDLKDYQRYYDRSRYLDSCFVDRGVWTPYGLAVTQINTCYH